METTVGNTIVRVVKGDITKESVDAIVNAANSSLMGGGGVDGAIHRAGGRTIHTECKAIVAKIGKLPTGEAVITSAGNMPSKHIIHTVGPVYRGGRNDEEQLLHNAYYNSLKIGRDNDVQSIAFPSISTGIYGYPMVKATETALKAIKSFLENETHNYKEVKLVAFSNKDLAIIEKALEKV